MEISYNSIGTIVRALFHSVPGFADLNRTLQRLETPAASARYCYSVWFRHWITAHENGFRPNLDIVMELGPGDSIGCGLCALLSGAESYVALDRMERINMAYSMDMFDALVDLFESKSPIPDDEEFPGVYPKLKSYEFPVDISTAPGQSKISQIRHALAHLNSKQSCIRYFPDYETDTNFAREGMDFIFSQAVLEHVDEIDALYRATWRWLKPRGVVSHQIDYRSHGTSVLWNGHWRYSDMVWRLIRGKRQQLINRLTHSDHLELLAESGFNGIVVVPQRAASEIKHDDLAPRFRTMNEEDITICSALFQAVKDR